MIQTLRVVDLKLEQISDELQRGQRRDNDEDDKGSESKIEKIQGLMQGKKKGSKV